MAQVMDRMAENGMAQGQTPAPEAAVRENKTPHGIPIGGHFNKTPSSYWSLALPALSVRYVAEVISNIAKKLPPRFRFSEKGAERLYAGSAGAFMLGVSGFYMGQTYRDMRNLFAEPVGWELNKKPEDVGFFDILKSKNSLVEAARKNFFKYNKRRIAVNSVFFSSMLPDSIAGITLTGLRPSADHAVKLGTGANGLYLMNDVLHRKETFFEALQSFVATKINHAERVGEMITANDLMNLYDRHARDKNKFYALPAMDTPEWQKDLLLFGRMADLMNQTYGNKPATEKADFTVAKLVYLLGNGLVKSESLEKNLAYVELANRTNDMNKVQQMAAEFKQCNNLDDVLKQFSITLPVAAPQPAPVVEVPPDSFAARVGENRAPARDIAPPAASHVERSAQRSSESMALGTA